MESSDGVDAPEVVRWVCITRRRKPELEAGFAANGEAVSGA